MTPSQLAEATQAVVARSRKEVEDAQTKLKMAAERQAKDLEALHTATAEYVQLGYANLRASRPYIYDVSVHQIGWGHRGFAWTQYFRQLAKELNRPYVRVGEWLGYGVHTHHTLCLPKRRYMDVTIGHLHLLPDGIVGNHSNTVDYRFAFHGTTGQEMLEDWKERARTDPDFRRALRVT